MSKAQPTAQKSVVLITGASSGFGEAMAEKYNANGHPLILIARRFQKLESLAARLNQDYPIHIAEVDVSNKVSIDTFLDNLPKKLQSIGVLINNAGLALGTQAFNLANENDFETMIQTNINGLLYMTKRVLPYMLAHHKGHIVNIGSTAGNWPYGGGNVYCGTKAFVQQFSRALRSDLQGENIRVSNIEPGMAETEFSVVRFKGDQEQADNVYQGTQALEAEDIANIVYFTTSLPQHVNINTLEVMPTSQSWGPLHVVRNKDIS
ncbi:SDR family NAD(P)-dependent oxidoreductase [Fangia hongkongensis]|uniref:SDR family NAD(P)-dependent oxidoreductase n=1 Tax=Fangia hongkongensis TaxID=270495 RepID=UPI000377930C|nr:SDR family NAD(P)-dependent oxidoreductase [Fangia hongkongensis]MBK2125775.1 SDR family NAD(P)-dependent oxidoreductase [Fangia hongkongensis]